MKLAEYVKRRNGVPMGSNHALKNMLLRSLGAGSFTVFWRHWNPVWSYYLGKFIYKPLKTFLPPALALWLTFGFCGFLHDLVIMLIRGNFALLFTPWFFIMALWLIVSDYFNINHSGYHFLIRAFSNILAVAVCFILAWQLQV